VKVTRQAIPAPEPPDQVDAPVGDGHVMDLAFVEGDSISQGVPACTVEKDDAMRPASKESIEIPGDHQAVAATGRHEGQGQT